MIRVLLVDDHRLLLARLRSLLHAVDDVEVVGTAADGAVGYLLKDAEPGELVRGVRAAAAGESPLDAKVARTLLARQTERSSDTLLSDREREVLTLVAAGWPTSRSRAASGSASAPSSHT